MRVRVRLFGEGFASNIESATDFHASDTLTEDAGDSPLWKSTRAGSQLTALRARSMCGGSGTPPTGGLKGRASWLSPLTSGQMLSIWRFWIG